MTLRGSNPARTFDKLNHLLTVQIPDVCTAHHQRAKEPKKAHRKWSEGIPYATHSIWLAMMVTTEEKIDEDDIVRVATMLLWHDVPEDTNMELPKYLDEEMRAFIAGMTYYGGMEQEMVEVWDKHELVILAKLYDKTHNFLNASSMKQERIPRYVAYVERLIAYVVEHFGELNIILFARATVARVRKEYNLPN